MTAADGFRARFGYDPVGVWSAPGRVNLIGEHTDYNDGFVLPFAIDRRTSVAVALRGDRMARVSSETAEGVAELGLDSIARETTRGWSAYPFGTAWGLGAVGASLAELPGFDAHFASDVPQGAGLSSSAAIECALAVALDELWSAGLTRVQLVRAAHLAENEIVGAPTGILDQSASLLAETDAALFLDCRDGSSQTVPLRLAENDLVVLVIDTRVEHEHATGGYAERRASCERGAAALGVAALRDLGVADLDRAVRVLDDETFRRVRHVVTENQRVQDTVATLRESGPRAIGHLLVASHASLRDDFEVTVPQLDLAVEASVAAGALGARMTGGGFGGSAIALVPTEREASVAEAVTTAFADAGYERPTVFAVRASAGARRDA